MQLFLYPGLEILFRVHVCVRMCKHAKFHNMQRRVLIDFLSRVLIDFLSGVLIDFLSGVLIDFLSGSQSTDPQAMRPVR